MGWLECSKSPRAYLRGMALIATAMVRMAGMVIMMVIVVIVDQPCRLWSTLIMVPDMRRLYSLSGIKLIPPGMVPVFIIVLGKGGISW